MVCPLTGGQFGKTEIKMTDVIKESLFASLVVMAVVLAAYNFYIAPRDAMLNEVMTCMDGDRSRLAYDLCFEEYTKNRR